MLQAVIEKAGVWAEANWVAAAARRSDLAAHSYAARDAIAGVQDGLKIVDVAEIFDAVRSTGPHDLVLRQDVDDPAEIIGGRNMPAAKNGRRQQPPLLQREFSQTQAKLLTRNMPILAGLDFSAMNLADGIAQT